MKSWHYALIVFLGGCCYGILSTFVKLAYNAGFSTPEVTGTQYFFGAVLSWIFVIFVKKKNLTLKQVMQLLLSGIPFGLTGMFYYQSLQTINASLAIVLLFQFVWIGTIYEWLLQKKKPTRNKLISIGVLLSGSVLAANIISQGSLSLTWQGTIWGLLAASTFALFIFLSGSVAKETSPILKSALLSTGAVITVFVVFPPTFLFNLDVMAGITPYGLILGVFGVLLPPLLYSIGMPHIGSGMGTIMTASELPMAVIMSSLVLGEVVSWFQWTGVIIILSGIAFSNLRKRRTHQQAERQDYTPI
ncbi:EamA family transporter [Paenibacillus tundrae]|uniref:Drug/metabolite transporter (DMT)-like permease n=1 Tax=Paenibacillus tundrae TaxID=528187 RepID=A0ABT9WDY8_9BACL|nr:DMT family transporter [Paenibacillus tundrae]MDQ0171350.1 drug/metabolite transporter (DMT)-like permease [Paenibacillus tundrae]